MKKAVVLLSGGLDSATVLAIAREEGYSCHALTITYGQRHGIEIEAAKRVSAALAAVDHRFVHVDLDQIGGSALTAPIAVPKRRSERTMSAQIPLTYVPARNTVFLSIALGYAEVTRAFDIFIGANAVDYSGYPDCRPEYLRAFETLANLATKAGVEGNRFHIKAPLIDLPKTEIIKKGLALGLDYGITHSCYDPSPTGEPCGDCDSCLIRLRAFADLGMPDPVYSRG